MIINKEQFPVLAALMGEFKLIMGRKHHVEIAKYMARYHELMAKERTKKGDEDLVSIVKQLEFLIQEDKKIV